MTRPHQEHPAWLVLMVLGAVIVTVCVILPRYLWWLGVGRWFDKNAVIEPEDAP